MGKEVIKKKEGSDRKNKIFLPIFIAAVMIFSTMGFMLGQNDTGTSNTGGQVAEEGGFKFQRGTSDNWIVNVGGKNFWVDYLPSELETELAGVKVPVFFAPEKVYIIYNPKEKENNLEYVLGKVQYTLVNLGKKAVFACDSTEGCPDIPVKDCREDFAFYFKKAENARVFTDDKCVVIEGDYSAMNKIADLIDLRLIGFGA